ncbi:MAG: hypothetical protein J5552_07775 [Prevotella sp.]|nr:hypothetical protein [Prevotella sp.]
MKRSKNRHLTGGALLICLVALSSMVTSCGEYWDGGEPVAARKMTLGRRVVNLVVGDRYRIPVIFEPDTLSNRSVFWQTVDNKVAVVENDTVIGMAEGLTLAYALSVSDHQSDSCWVNVLPSIYLNPKNYPYDMVIYADVTIHGHPYTKADEDSLIVAAYVNNELRGIGKMREWKGRPYMELRLWNNNAESNDLVELRCYYRGRGLAEIFPTYYFFDGDAHGSLSHLEKLVLDDDAREYAPWDAIGIDEPIDTLVAI